MPVVGIIQKKKEFCDIFGWDISTVHYILVNNKDVVTVGINWGSLSAQSGQDRARLALWFVMVWGTRGRERWGDWWVLRFEVGILVQNIHHLWLLIQHLYIHVMKDVGVVRVGVANSYHEHISSSRFHMTLHSVAPVNVTLQYKGQYYPTVQAVQRSIP